MKAILVIDLPVALEHLLGEEMLLHISHKDGRYIMTEYALLRPLPNAINERGKWISEEYQKGWNACLKEIEE